MDAFIQDQYHFLWQANCSLKTNRTDNPGGWNIEGAQHTDPLKQVAKTISSLAPLAYVSIWRVGKERWKQIINSLLWNDLIRCDQKADCDDQSDEASCQIVYFNPDQYLKVSVFVISQISWSWNILMHQDKPPPPLEIGAKVQILVNVDIKRVLTISEVMRNVICKRHFWYLDREAYSAFWVETLPKAQRTRELSSYHEFTVHKSWSNYNFRISIKHWHQNLKQTLVSRQILIKPSFSQDSTS